MAYSLVQAQAGQAGSNPGLPANATAGHLIVVVGLDISGTIAISDGSYTRATAAGRAAIWYKVAAGGERSVTLTGGSVPAGFMAEFSGNASSSPLDQVSSIVTGASSPLSPALPVADAAAGELVIGGELWSLSKAGTQTSGFTFNNGASGARWAVGESDDASSLSQHWSAWWGVTTGNSAADTGSASSSSMNVSSGVAVMASFKLPGAGNTYTKAGYAKENA